jgi:glycoprotein endo-alpha-1,2-mannosidase
MVHLVAQRGFRLPHALLISLIFVSLLIFVVIIYLLDAVSLQSKRVFPRPRSSSGLLWTEKEGLIQDLERRVEKEESLWRPIDGILAFYYPWYSSLEHDGKWGHWNHRIMDDREPPYEYKPPHEIGAVHYPRLGPYSSSDESVIRQHLLECRLAGIKTLVYSWTGINRGDDADPFPGRTHDILPIFLDEADKLGLDVAIHLEPHKTRTAASVGEDVSTLMEAFHHHPAFRPWFFVYDSYLITEADWRKELLGVYQKFDRGKSHNPGGKDLHIVGLCVDQSHLSSLLRAGFSSFYTYFGADRFSWGSSWTNWKRAAEFAASNDMMFIPCVSPGYEDIRVRPWNPQTTRDRGNGKYFDGSWEAALELVKTDDVHVVAITSYNEWHEGTQIESAAQHDGFQDYGESVTDPFKYLIQNRKWADRFADARSRNVNRA